MEPKTIEQAAIESWKLLDARRSGMQKRIDYYDGKHAILSIPIKRVDGVVPSRIVTNWVKFIANQHAGFLLGREAKIVLMREEEGDRQALAQYEAAKIGSNLPSLDIQHFIAALLCGYSVEAYGWDGKAVSAVQYSPLEWCFVFSDSGIAAAVHRREVPAGYSIDGVTVQASASVEWRVYTAGKISVYRSSGSDKQELVKEDANPFGVVPVVLFKVSADGLTYFKDDFITQQDNYNEVRSANSDDVRYNVDAYLLLKGYAPAQLLKLDENGEAEIQKLRELKLIPLDKDGDAKFIEKGNSVDKARFELDLSRDAIHMMGETPDIGGKILGATGNTSGIALKLMFHGMEQAAARFSHHFVESVRRRVSMFNLVWKKAGKPTLDFYKVELTPNIPVNEIEQWQNIPNLESVLTIRDRLRQLDSVSDPDRAAADKLKELESTRATGEGQGTEGAS